MTEKDITICGHGSNVPSTKNLNTYNTTRYNSNKPIVAVVRLKSLTDVLRQSFHDTYKSILGRNKYSQNLRNYVYTAYKDGKYYSDCSSSGCATFKKIGLNIPLLNTVGMYQSSLFTRLDVKIKDGHITNPEILKVGDCILYAGTDTSRPLKIGHVEYVYEIKNEKNTNKVVLNNETIYASSTSEKGVCKKSGTFYYWDNKVVNGRIRITNSESNIGKASQITGWIKKG